MKLKQNVILWFLYRLSSICVGRDHSPSVGVGVPVDGGQHAGPGRGLRHAAGTPAAAADAEAHQDRDRIDRLLRFDRLDALVIIAR